MDIATALKVAAKHFDDSASLLESKRYDNSAYLAGYVVECCLKAILVHPSLPVPKELGHDISLQFKKTLHFCLALAPDRRRLNFPKGINSNHAIWDWDVSIRYAPAGSIDSSKAALFHEAAKAFIETLWIQKQLDNASLTQ